MIYQRYAFDNLMSISRLDACAAGTSCRSSLVDCSLIHTFPAPASDSLLPLVIAVITTLRITLPSLIIPYPRHCTRLDSCDRPDKGTLRTINIRNHTLTDYQRYREEVVFPAVVSSILTQVLCVGDLAEPVREL